MSEATEVLIGFNILSLTLCGYTAFHLVRFQQRRLVDLKVQYIVNYAISIPGSAVAHLVRYPLASRGYYDAFENPSANSQMTVLVFCLTIAIAIVLTKTGNFSHLRNPATVRAETENRTMRPRAAALITIIAISPPALIALSALHQYLASVSPTARIISLDSGMARFVFAANWLVWSLSLAVLLVMHSTRRFREIITVTSTVLAVIAIFSALSWSGTRSLGLLMAMPLIILVWPVLRKYAWWLLPFASGALFIYIIALYSGRGAAASTPLATIVESVDWQWGRYSMLVWAHSWTQQHPLMLGATVLNGLVATFVGVLQFIGVQTPAGASLLANGVAGQSILGTSDTYLVPGFGAELLVNFGPIGLLVGFTGVSYLVAKIQDRLEACRSEYVRLMYAYLGCILVYRSIQNDSDSFWTFGFYTGLPILVLAVVARFSRDLTPSITELPMVFQYGSELTTPEFSDEPISSNRMAKTSRWRH